MWRQAGKYVGLITGLRAKINKGSGAEFFKCESCHGNKSILQGAAFLYGRLVPPYTQVTCSRCVLIGLNTSLTLVVLLSQMGVGGEFFKDIFDCEMANLRVQQKKNQKTKPLKCCDMVSETCFGLHTCAPSHCSCPLFSVSVMSCCNQLFTAGARLNRWADKRKGKKDCGQGLQSKLHQAMKELCGSVSRIALMSPPQSCS